MADQQIVDEFIRLFQDQQLQQQFVANQGAYVGEHFPPGCTPEDLQEGAQQALQQAGINQGTYAGYGGGPPVGGDLAQTAAYYTSVYNNYTIDDRDTAVNNQINAIGDVNVETNVASGDGAVVVDDAGGPVGVATGDQSTAAGVNTGQQAGAGGIAAGDDVDQAQAGAAGGDQTQQQQNIDVDYEEAPPPPPPPNGGDPEP
jgi:hypothetical protein